MTAEHAFYRQLLDLHREQDITALVQRALALVVQATAATHGWISLRHPENPQQVWQLGHQVDDEKLGEIRSHISSGVISAALERGETICLEDTQLDPTFGQRASVRRARIRELICAPIGTDPALGVVYLQDRREPGPFPDQAISMAELFASQLNVVTRALFAPRPGPHDPTAPFRARLRDHEGLIGRSLALAHVLENVANVAPTRFTVLLQGSSGTGKSHVARLIHQNSKRRAGPFVEVNCGAIPPDLFENEMFGHARGAFTGATGSTRGWVQRARGGTLFLDEIADLPLTQQPKLLTLLQNGTFYTVGDSAAKKADIRLIAATHIDLLNAVEAGTFRLDLYHRLAGVTIHLPSLNERPEDIPDLARFLLEREAREADLPTPRLHPTALAWLAGQSWPGNLRELAAVLRRGLLRVWSTAEPITADTLIAPKHSAGRESAADYKGAVRTFKVRYLRAALEQNGWVVARTARAVGLSPQGLHHLIAEFKLRPGPDQG